MKFIGQYDLSESLRRYKAYLESVADTMPHSAFAYASAPWHYDDGTKGCHDSWLETLELREDAEGDRSQFRSTQLHIRLLGAYHDRHITLSYANVISYELSTHGDWLTDEVILSEQGTVLHEIVWSSGSRWLIECADLSVNSAAVAKSGDV